MSPEAQRAASGQEASGERPAIFLDRDGTLIDELGYLADPGGVKLLPGAAEALAKLGAHPWPLVLITNQSGVARGLLDEPTLERVHQELQRQLGAHGAALEAIYYCPHHPQLGPPRYRQDCPCRKPKPGMYQAAAQELGLALASSVAVGDTERDLEAAQRAGIPTRILVLTGKGQETFEAWEAQGQPTPATHVEADLSAALKTILTALGEA